MSEAIIKAEGLGKRYILDHQSASGGGGYRRLSEALLRPFQRASRGTTSGKEEFWALKDISFEIKQGEVVGIIGRNGAGKSTLLKILSRITEPTQGRITLRGRVASLLEVGTGFHPELTGRENIYLNGAILGMTRAEIKGKFDEIVAFAEIERFLDTPVKRYSSGMYVRLAFAVAAHLDPEILIVDEVLAVGDAQFQKKCLGKMQDVASGGRTVLFVSHNLSVIQELCTRAILLSTGTVVMEGKPPQVTAAYALAGLGRGSEVDLTRSKRAGACREGCRLERAAATVGSADRSFVFNFNERIQFAVTLSNQQPVQDADLAVALLTPGRFEIASTLSSHSMSRTRLEPGTHEFRVRYENLRLAPGVYTIDLGVRSGRGIEDRITDAFQFEVLAEEGAVEASTHLLGGVVIPEVSYTYEQKHGLES